MTDRLALIGMMGSGKSATAAVLATRLGWSLVDTDADVVRRTGTEIADLFALQGEEAFRAEESQVLSDALHRSTSVVVATGGGAVLDPASRDLLAHQAQVVWLRASTETLAERLADTDDRPLLAGGVSRALSRLDAERRPLYESTADWTVDVDGLSIDEVVDRVLESTGFVPVHQGARPGMGQSGQPSDPTTTPGVGGRT